MRAHAHKPNTHTRARQGVCNLGRWAVPDGPIMAFLSVLENHMLYSEDDTPAEVDPEEMRTGTRVLGAPFDRVRVNLYLTMRHPVKCVIVEEVECVDPYICTR